MPETPPPVNPNVNEIADRAKYEFAMGTKVLAQTQYRLAELAGLGLLDPEASMDLQDKLFEVWECLYAGTLSAIHDSSDDWTWIETDNTYSDGRTIRTIIRIEPVEESDFTWEHNRFCLGDGAVAEHPLGTICYIAPINPADRHCSDVSSFTGDTDFESSPRRIQMHMSRNDVDITRPSDGEDDEEAER